MLFDEGEYNLHVRGDVTRSNCIDLDVMLCPFVGKGFGELS